MQMHTKTNTNNWVHRTHGHCGTASGSVESEHSPTRSAKPPSNLARFTGLDKQARRRWREDPRQYVCELLRTSLQQAHQVQAAPCTVPVSTGDKVKAAVKGGTIGFSVSFMLAKAWTSLWGWLSVLAKDDPRLFFLIGTGGYVLIASGAHATLAKAAGFAPGGNYGGPQAPDKAAFENYITLLGMWYVATADKETEQAARIAQAIQEVMDGVIARAKQHEDAGHPLCFDFRHHPMLGAWLRNGHFHLAFFWYSVTYLVSGGLAPVLRQVCMKMPGSVLQRAGLYHLFDFLLSATCGQVAGVLTLAGHMLGNKHIQRGPDKPGLHQSWPQEMKAAMARLAHLNTGWSQFYELRERLVTHIATGPMDESERAHWQQILNEQWLPEIDRAMKQLQDKQAKWLRRSEKLTSPEGRDEIASDKAFAMTLKGAGKTAHKLINSSPHAQGLRSAGEALGNIPSLIPMACALMGMSALFASYMPFAEHAPGPLTPNGAAPWSQPMPGGANLTLPSDGMAWDVLEWSLAMGWILIAGFSGIRPFSIPGAELMLNLILATLLRLGHWTGLRQRANPAPPGIEHTPPPPPEASALPNKPLKPRRFDPDGASSNPGGSATVDDSSRPHGSSMATPHQVINREIPQDDQPWRLQPDESAREPDDAAWPSSLTDSGLDSDSDSDAVSIDLEDRHRGEDLSEEGLSDSATPGSGGPQDGPRAPVHMARQSSVANKLLDLIAEIKQKAPLKN